MAEAQAGMARSQERQASTFNGYLFLLLWLATIVVGAWRIAMFHAYGPTALGGWLMVTSIVLFFLILCGFFMIHPNTSAVLTLFGSYRGTERTQGLRLIWPWMGRKKISVRQNNIHSERVKVNDLRGNPIEVACN